MSAPATGASAGRASMRLTSARPGQGRRQVQPRCAKAPARVDPRDPRLPQAGDRLQGHHAACWPIPRRSRTAVASSGRLRAPVARRLRGGGRGARLSARPGAGARAGRRLRARAQARQASVRDDQRRVPARVRRRPARAAHRRRAQRQAGARPRRSAGHGRHGEGAVRAGRSARRRGRGVRVPRSSSPFSTAASGWRRTMRTRCSPTSPRPGQRAHRASQPHDRRVRRGAVGGDLRSAPSATLVAARGAGSRTWTATRSRR